MQRMKTSLQQVRAQCANDIRKRDIEIQKLKSHLTDRQRGKRDVFGVTTISITPAPKINNKKTPEGGDGIDNPGYSLKEETTEFLTHLCQDLSDENDTLIGILKDSIHTLRSLQGLPDQNSDETEEANQAEGNKESEPQTMTPPHYEKLASEMVMVLDQLRALLTNPSFVPLEEVEMRDNEIYRLREGWEKMESRWREAIAMMDKWHKRIAKGGESINIHELQQGMGISLGIDEQTSFHSHADREENSFCHKESKNGEWSGENACDNPSGTRSKPVSKRKVTIHDTALEERSGNAHQSSSHDVVAPTRDSEEDSKENGDDTSSLEKPDTAKRQKIGSLKRRDTKLPRQVCILVNTLRFNNANPGKQGI